MFRKIIISTLFSIPAIIFAEGKIVSPLRDSGITSIGQLLEVIVSGVTYIAIPIIVVALMWVGFKFVSSQGKTEEINKAKNTL